MKKLESLLRRPLTSVILSIFIGLLVGAVALSAAGFHPIEAYAALLKGIFSKPRYMVQVIIRATPIILTGLSVAFAFKTGMFNIGAEGQYVVGAMAAVIAGSQISLPKGIHFVVVIAAGMLAAGLWGALAGLLKSKYGIHEVITCIMLNWIALYMNNFFISQPWLKKPGTEASYEVAQSAWSVVLGEWKMSPEGLAYLKQNPKISDVLLRTDMNYGILIAIAVVLLVWFLLGRTALGFELRAVGSNKDGARFSGININRSTVISMFIAGALAGLAGALSITGTMPHRITMLAAHEGFGFDGISVALIAGAHPIGCLLSGLLFGALKYGSSSLQIAIGAPSEVINIVIGAIVFCVAMSSVFPMMADYLAKKGEKKHVG